MGRIKKSSLLISLIFVFTTGVYSQDTIYGKYIVKEIDSTSLFYYYIVKVSMLNNDSIRLNILSEKKPSVSNVKNKNLCVGKTYNLSLEPIYSIVDKRHDKDSVWLSPATMRSVMINNETYISADYSVHPFKAVELKGLMYYKYKKKCLKKKQ